MVALNNFPKCNRQSARIETLRERGYSEQELAATERLDRSNLLVFLIALSALLLSAGLYVWYIFANPAGTVKHEAVAASEDNPASIPETGTVADFFRSKPEETSKKGTSRKAGLIGSSASSNLAGSADIDSSHGGR